MDHYMSNISPSRSQSHVQSRLSCAAWRDIPQTLLNLIFIVVYDLPHGCYVGTSTLIPSSSENKNKIHENYLKVREIITILNSSCNRT
jgi:hypothetical protein